MGSKDGGPDSLLGPSEFGKPGGVSKVSLHKHWGHVYGRWSRGSGNEQGPGLLTSAHTRGWTIMIMIINMI